MISSIPDQSSSRSPRFARWFLAGFGVLVAAGTVAVVERVKERSARILVSASYLEEKADAQGGAPVGLGASDLEAWGFEGSHPWPLGAQATSFEWRFGESWQEMVEREIPECTFVTETLVDNTSRLRFLHDEMRAELRTLVLRVGNREPEATVALVAGRVEDFTSGGRVRGLLLRTPRGSAHEFARRSLSWVERPRTFWEKITGEPALALEVSFHRGDRGVSELIRWADGPPWGQDILDSVLEPKDSTEPQKN